MQILFLGQSDLAVSLARLVSWYANHTAVTQTDLYEWHLATLAGCACLVVKVETPFVPSQNCVRAGVPRIIHYGVQWQVTDAKNKTWSFDKKE